MPRKIQEPEVQEDSEYSEEPTPPVKPKKKMSEKQLEILRQGRLKAIERRKEISKELEGNPSANEKISDKKEED